MLHVGMLGNATFKQKNQTRIFTWLICRQAKWSAHGFLFFFFSFLVAFFCIYFELATFALKLMMMTMIKLMCQLPSIAELLNA